VPLSFLRKLRQPIGLVMIFGQQPRHPESQLILAEKVLTFSQKKFLAGNLYTYTRIQ
jgi:hypothetical protein